jgi:hypothetical protein
MSISLRIGLVVTDVGFLAYWCLSALFAAGLVNVPAEWLFADYHDARVIAWNWSFLPLDVAFSIIGLTAIRRYRKGDASWRHLAIISLVLSSTAGGMAVSYWALLGAYEPIWLEINLALFAWPLFFIPGLIRDAAAAATPPAA